MSHDRGCWKCGRDIWDYDNCDNPNCIKASLNLNGIEPPILNGESVGSNPVGKTIFKQELTYECPNNIRETDPYRAAAWYLREASAYRDNMLGDKHTLSFSQALWIAENSDKVREILDALDKEIK